MIIQDQAPLRRPLLRHNLLHGPQRSSHPLQARTGQLLHHRPQSHLPLRLGRPIPRRHDRHHPHLTLRPPDGPGTESVHPRPQRRHRPRRRRVSQGHLGLRARHPRETVPLGRRPRLPPRHGPRRRVLPQRARGPHWRRHAGPVQRGRPLARQRPVRRARVLRGRQFRHPD